MPDLVPRPVFVQASSEDRMWGVACHLSACLSLVLPVPGAGVVGPLAVWLAKRDESAFVEDQGRAALNFQLTMAVLALATLPLVILLVGIPLLWAISIIDTVFIIVASIQAGSGKAYRYPFTMEFVRARDPA